MLLVGVGVLAIVVDAGGGTAHARERLLHYNHAYGVVDSVTADAVEGSAFLRGFANFEVRTTTGADGRTWTGRYLLGRETYLELFERGDLPEGDAEVAAVLGVSTEDDGDLDAVLRRLPHFGVPEPVEFTQTRDFGDGVPVPWFDTVIASPAYDTFTSWAMEYRPEYFADPRGGTEPPDHPGDVGRERYLSDDYRDHAMRDLTALRIGVTRQDLANVTPLLRAGGFTVVPAPGGGVAVRGSGTTLRFDVVPRAEAGLRQVEMSLNRPARARHVERIGYSTLVVGPGPRAVWTFDRP